MGSIIGTLILLALYFLPALVAKSGRHPNSTAIFALNLLLGWTFIGWVVALVWALTGGAQGHDVMTTRKETDE